MLDFDAKLTWLVCLRRFYHFQLQQMLEVIDQEIICTINYIMVKCIFNNYFGFLCRNLKILQKTILVALLYE